MKLIYIPLLLSLSFYLCAGTNKELYKGIELFELGHYGKAIKVLQPLANSDDELANYYMGLIYDPEFNRQPFSRKVIKYKKANEQKTRQYYEKAADLGLPYATYQLGRYFQSMNQKRQNFKRGDRLLNFAKKDLKVLAQKGDWLAKYMVASITGSTITRSLAKEAFNSMEVEAKKGNRKAQFYLGKSHSQWHCNLEECKDYSLAYAWFAIATVQGSYHAKYHLLNLKNIMSEDQIMQASKLADEFIVKYRKSSDTKT